LKTLEEPPSFLVFILATTEVHALLPTIMSRSQRFAFRKVGEQDIATELQRIATAEQRQLQDGAARRIADASEGCVRDAVSLLGQVLALGDAEVGEATIDLLLPPSPAGQVQAWLEALTNRDAIAALAVLEVLLDDGFSPERFVKDVMLMLERVQRGAEEVRGLDAATAARLLDRHLQAYRQLGYSPLPQLPLEIVTDTKGEDPDASRLLSQVQEAPVVKFTDAMLTSAVKLRASDLLLEPREKAIQATLGSQ